jgi:orotidine-5'-phosphate decarboxylase
VTEIIVAVDGYSYKEAEDKQVLGQLAQARSKEMIWGIKISDMLYTGNALKMIGDLKDTYKLNVMADVKLHDIPSTTENSLKRLVEAGADIVTVHCSSNFKPKNAELLKNIAGVTVLTSFTNLEMKWIYERETSQIIKDFADLAQMNRYGYIVGSVQGMKHMENNPLKKICTGIRPHWYTERHDQVRIDSVKEAVRSEADYIVIGRPILRSDDIVATIKKIYTEID